MSPDHTKTSCPICKGTGIDFKHLWPDGTPAYCEECGGYGDVNK